jgi:peptidoglycan/xylan/chitin deacetylase (PgdA/CDA1 family)
MMVIPILMYHSILREAAPAFKPFALSPECFAAHVAYLHAQNFTPLTVAQFAERLEAFAGAVLPAKPVILTFDDGFADFYHHALPTLQTHGFCATLYVVTGYMELTSLWLRREGEAHRPMLTWQQLSEIDAAGIECGAHTCTHPHLDVVSEAIARDEIRHSKDMLEQRLGKRVTTFAFPYGHYTQSTQQLVCEAGFTAACAVKHALSYIGDDQFGLARITIRDDTNVPQLAALLAGRGLAIASHREKLLTKSWRWIRRLRQTYRRMRP